MTCHCWCMNYTCITCQLVDSNILHVLYGAIGYYESHCKLYHIYSMVYILVYVLLGTSYKPTCLGFW